MNEDELTDELRWDLLLYGEAFVDSDGNRIDPTTVTIPAPEICAMAPYAHE